MTADAQIIKRIGLRSKEFILLVLVLLYFAGVAAFLVRWRVLELPITLAGVVLAALIPIVLEDARLVWRVALTGLPVVGVALTQISDSEDTATAFKRLSNNMSSLQLQSSRDEIGKCEARLQERIVLDPRDVLATLSYSSVGFELKAKRLDLHALALQAKIQSAAKNSKELSLLVQQVNDTHNEAMAYRILQRQFDMRAKPVYEKLIRAKSPLQQDDLKLALDPVAADLSQLWFIRPLSGLSYHLGLLAVARSNRNEAFAHFYEGVTEDPHNLANYEALGFYAWAMNRDGHTAALYATLGLDQATSEIDQAATDVREALAFTPMTKQEKTHLRTFQAQWVAYLRSRQDRLTLQRAYFDALLFQDEPAARRSIKQLWIRDPKDADYQDALGFVLMRFARSEAELREAQSLFQSSTTGSSQRITPILADAHLSEANLLISEVTDEGAEKALLALRQRCR